MLPVFLIGGGGDHPERGETYGRFLRAVLRHGPRLALIAASDDPTDAQETVTYTRAIFTALGAAEADIEGIILSPEKALTVEMLAALQPAGVFVCGGMTPLYQEVLCQDLSWLDYLRVRGITYGGVSAGAAIAAATAIVGGWQAERDGQVRSILFQGADEGRDLLDVRPGLELVPFTVEIHASQWGTLTRMLHAIDHGLVSEGWGIDENTLLQVDDSGLHVYGQGHAYYMRRGEMGTAQVTIHRAPEHIPWPG